MYDGDKVPIRSLSEDGELLFQDQRYQGISAEIVQIVRRVGSNELRVRNCHINSKMLHKDKGGYDVVRRGFTSMAYTALAEDMDVIAGDGSFTNQRDKDLTTSLCVEVLEAVLTAINSLHALERRITEWLNSVKGEPVYDGAVLS